MAAPTTLGSVDAAVLLPLATGDASGAADAPPPLPARSSANAAVEPCHDTSALGVRKRGESDSLDGVASSASLLPFRPSSDLRNGIGDSSGRDTAPVAAALAAGVAGEARAAAGAGATTSALMLCSCSAAGPTTRSNVSRDTTRTSVPVVAEAETTAGAAASAGRSERASSTASPKTSPGASCTASDELVPAPPPDMTKHARAGLARTPPAMTTVINSVTSAAPAGT